MKDVMFHKQSKRFYGLRFIIKGTFLRVVVRSQQRCEFISCMGDDTFRESDNANDFFFLLPPSLRFNSKGGLITEKCSAAREQCDESHEELLLTVSQCRRNCLRNYQRRKSFALFWTNKKNFLVGNPRIRIEQEPTYKSPLVLHASLSRSAFKVSGIETKQQTTDIAMFWVSKTQH